MITNKCVLKEGDRLNYLTVVDYNNEKKRYICRCDCGTITEQRTWAIKSGKVKSCGCMMETLRAERVAKSNFKSIKNNLYKLYKAAAKRRGYEFGLTKERYTELILQNCHYCGVEPNMTFTYGQGASLTDYSEFKYHGVDRIDNNIGYIEGNVVPCCKICNNSKSTLTLEEWIQWIQRVNHYIDL